VAEDRANGPIGAGMEIRNEGDSSQIVGMLFVVNVQEGTRVTRIRISYVFVAKEFVCREGQIVAVETTRGRGSVWVSRQKGMCARDGICG
jgi:hypothetical protein